MFKGNRLLSILFTAIIAFLMMAPLAIAGEADIKLPDLSQVSFMGGALGGLTILNWGLVVCAIGLAFGLLQYVQTKNLPAHKAMLDVSNTIWETCKTYIIQQGKFLAGLWVLIAICMVYYFSVLSHMPMGEVGIILACSILGILGSYGVAWFGIRINTVANSRAAFASLTANPLSMLSICLRSGMSVGLLLVSVELFFMIIILAYLGELAGPCFIGFAIGESLGASALRICGGIFTKIADIGSDLMKIVFKLPEDDPKNPGVIADCTGDNAGDSVGPTADGFETYGVTGVALIAFLALALAASPTVCATLIIWLFVMRSLMIVTSLGSYFLNEGISKAMFGGKKDFDFEAPLTHLVWITSAVSIAITFIASKVLLGDFAFNGVPQPALWWVLSGIISCGRPSSGKDEFNFFLPWEKSRLDFFFMGFLKSVNDYPVLFPGPLRLIENVNHPHPYHFPSRCWPFNLLADRKPQQGTTDGGKNRNLPRAPINILRIYQREFIFLP